MPLGGHPAKLFINYRREDTAPYAGRLYDRLVAHFGEDQVFMDIDQIEPGEDFVEVINRKVGACEIAIISIGPNWLSVTDDTGQRRIDDSEDLVRIEILAALDRKIRVIPVLVGGARMPRRQDLPEALAPLSRRNAIELSEMRFHSDVSRLIEAIEKPRALAEKNPEPLPNSIVSPPGPAAPLKPPESEHLSKTPSVGPTAELPTVPVALMTEPAPLEKLPDPVSSPQSAAVLPISEPSPVPVARIAEAAPLVEVPVQENPPKASPPPPPTAQDQIPNSPPAPRPQASAAITEKRRLGWILGDRAPRSQARSATVAAGAARTPNLPLVSRSQTPVTTRKKSKLPWILAGLGAGFALLLLVLFVMLISYVAPMVKSPYGERLEYKGRELYYTSSVTEADGKKLGECLVKIGFFDGNQYSVQLNKSGSIYEVRVWSKKGTDKNDSSMASNKNLCRFISLNVFDGRDVVVHLCDTNMETLRVLCP